MDERERDLYKPKPRYDHVAVSSRGQVIVWGGVTSDSDDPAADPSRLKLAPASVVEHFDPCTEVWCQRSTVGTPHPGLLGAACTLSHDGNDLFMYGGHGLGRDLATSSRGVLSRLNIKTLTWTLLCPEAVVGGAPMKKYSSGMFIFKCGDKVAVIGGYGYPTGLTQPGATFTKDTRFTDGSGWSNECHVFDISQGSQSSSLNVHTLMYKHLQVCGPPLQSEGLDLLPVQISH